MRTLFGGYLMVLGLLAILGLHRLLLLRRLSHPTAMDPPAGFRRRPVGPLPAVTVQLPIYNEPTVVERLIDAACALDYPSPLLEVQILDDSDDETSILAARRAARHRSRGLRVVHLRRPGRKGFKAGALAEGLRWAEGEMLAIFDADFLPPPDFLRRVVPEFADPAVGMVQCRWGHLNREESRLTRVQALCLDGHFAIDHAARHRVGLFFNFNGTAGIWRRRCLEEAGGWQADTVTEDLDLSYRAQMAGWRFVYRDDVVVPAEIPGTFHAVRTQQRRWATGSMQTARKLLPRMLGSSLPWRQKAEAVFHLAGNGAYLLLLLLSVLLLASLPVRASLDWSWRALEGGLFLAGTAPVVAYYLRSQRLRGVPAAQRWRSLPGILGFGIGLAVGNGLAVLQGAVRRGGLFRRTPKRGWNCPRVPGGGRPDPLVILQALLAAAFVSAALWAALGGRLAGLPLLALFAVGHGTGAAGLGAARRRRALSGGRARDPG